MQKTSLLFILPTIFCAFMLASCGSNSEMANIGPNIPGKWNIRVADLEDELKNNGLTFQTNNAGGKIMLATGGENGPHDLIYVFESGRLTKVTQTKVVAALDENEFMSQAKVFETDVLSSWNNRYEAMYKNLQPVQNTLKSFQIIARDNKKYANFLCIWFDNKTAQFTVQFFNPETDEAETAWNHLAKNDPGYIKR